MSGNYTAHLLSDSNPLETACGESWQGWQAPDQLDLRDPKAVTLPPHTEPRPHYDKVRQCQACLKVAMREPMRKALGG